MAEPFKRVTAGEKFRPDARTWNAMVAAGEAFARPSAFGAAVPVTEPMPPGVILVKNSTGSTIPRYGAVGFDGPILDADAAGFKEKIAMVAAMPAATTVLRFAVALEPIADGRTGWARASGLMIANINVRSASPATCGPKSGTHVLQSGAGGCRILWLASGSTPPEERLAIIEVGVPDSIRAIASGAHAAGASQNVTVCDESFASLGDSVPAINDSGVEIPDTTELYLLPDGDRWKIPQAFICEDPAP